MNPLRKKLASILTEAAREGIRALEPDSACVQALKKIDADNFLKEDIDKVCQVVSLSEVTKILSLAVRLQRSSQGKRETIKNSLKEIAEEIITKAEIKFGELKLPRPCRNLLFKL